MKNNLKGSIMLFIAAIIWGCAFVVQEEATAVGAFTLNGTRFIIGGFVLLPVIAIFNRFNKKNSVAEQPKQKRRKNLFIGGIVCGTALALASNLQQFGIMFNADIAKGDSGKAGFITALYIIIVPLFEIIFKKKMRPSVLAGILLSVIGLYLISVKNGFSIAVGDVFLILCALAFSLHIIVVAHWSPLTNGVALSSIQFFTTGIISLVLMFIFEKPNVSVILDTALPILYMGTMSSGVAYTLQVVGQKYSEPSIASIIMSLESLFALLAACVFYKQLPGTKEAIGCALMLTAIIVVETPFLDRLLTKIFKRKAKV